MATSLSQDGSVLEYNNAGSAISSGDVVVAGAAGAVTVGIALTDIAATSGVGSIAIEGVFTMAKLSAGVIVEGETVDWDSSGSVVDDNAMTPASGDVSDFGIAMETKGNGTTTVAVKLLPGNGAIT